MSYLKLVARKWFKWDYTDKQSIAYNHDLGTLIVPTLGQIVHQNTDHCRAVTAMFILVHSEDRSCLCLNFLYLFFSHLDYFSASVR